MPDRQTYEQRIVKAAHTFTLDGDGKMADIANARASLQEPTP